MSSGGFSVQSYVKRRRNRKANRGRRRARSVPYFRRTSPSPLYTSFPNGGDQGLSVLPPTTSAQPASKIVDLTWSSDDEVDESSNEEEHKPSVLLGESPTNPIILE